MLTSVHASTVWPLPNELVVLDASRGALQLMSTLLRQCHDALSQDDLAPAAAASLSAAVDAVAVFVACNLQNAKTAGFGLASLYGDG